MTNLSAIPAMPRSPRPLSKSSGLECRGGHAGVDLRTQQAGRCGRGPGALPGSQLLQAVEDRMSWRCNALTFVTGVRAVQDMGWMHRRAGRGAQCDAFVHMGDEGVAATRRAAGPGATGGRPGRRRRLSPRRRTLRPWPAGHHGGGCAVVAQGIEIDAEQGLP